MTKQGKNFSCALDLFHLPVIPVLAAFPSSRNFERWLMLRRQG